MIPNHNPTTNIAFGYVAAQELNDNLVADLLWGTGVEGFIDHGLAAAEEQAKAKATTQHEEYLRLSHGAVDPDDDEQEAAFQAILAAEPFIWKDSEEQENFCDNYDSNECQVEGKLDGVHYRSSWMGGALHFAVFDSPRCTDLADRASPCVPGAGILHRFQEGSVTCYTVPEDWWRDE